MRAVTDARRAVRSVLTKFWPSITDADQKRGTWPVAYGLAIRCGVTLDGPKPKSLAELQESDPKILLTGAKISEVEQLVHQSSRDRIAYDACILLVEALLRREVPLPVVLRKFTSRVLREELVRPAKSRTGVRVVKPRDLYICLAVNEAKKHGLDATRSTGKVASAAQIVVEEFAKLAALDESTNPKPLNEATVAKIWERSHLRDDKRSKPRKTTTV